MMHAETTVSPLDRPEGSEAQVFVQNLDAMKSNLSEQIQLIHQCLRRVFPLYVGEYVIPVRLALESDQILSVVFPHYCLRPGQWARHEVEEPD
jgi:hypothetical protein